MPQTQHETQTLPAQRNVPAQREQQRLWLRATVCVLLLLVTASVTGLTEAINRAVGDLHTRAWAYLHRNEPFPEQIVVVGVDDASVRKYGRLRDWSRSRYADLLDRMPAARAVGLDILFTEADARDSAGDARLANAIARQGRVVAPAFTRGDVVRVSNASQAQTSAALARLSPLPSQALALESVNPAEIETALPAISAHVASLAYADVNADADNVYRSPIVLKATGGANGKGRYFPHLTLAVAAVATGKTVGECVEAHEDGGVSLRVGARIIPLNNGALFLRSLARRGGSAYRTGLGAPVPNIGFADALVLPTSAWAGKIVLVGETATGTTDLRANPLDTGLRGVELNAEILANLLYVAPLQPLPLAAQWFSMLAAIVAPLYLLTFLAPRKGAFAALGVSALLLGVLEAGYWGGGLVPSWSPVLLGLFSSTLFAGLGRAAQENEKRRQIEDSFSAYVAPSQVARLAENPDALLERLQRQRMAVLFSDIRNFTAYSEQTEPDIVARQMSEYLSEMTGAVFAGGWFLDKFVGDAVMALFGPPDGEPANHSAAALVCALDMLTRLEILNERWRAEGLTGFRIGIGVHVGDALFGNVGSQDANHRRVQLTALGDTVNVAARLQTLTKEFQVALLVSDQVRAEAQPVLGHLIRFDDCGSHIVRGRETATHLFSVTRREAAESKAHL